MILIVDCCSEELSSREFVKPIQAIVKNKENKIVKLSEVTKHIDESEKIILCGTALKDFTYLDADFSWLKDCKKPVLGICAGMQLIAISLGAKLIDNKEIGMTPIITKDNVLGEIKEAYQLHGKSTTLPKGATVLYENSSGIQGFKKDNFFAIQFHPEVRNKQIVERFVNQINL